MQTVCDFMKNKLGYVLLFLAAIIGGIYFFYIFYSYEEKGKNSEISSLLPNKLSYTVGYLFWEEIRDRKEINLSKVIEGMYAAERGDEFAVTEEEIHEAIKLLHQDFTDRSGLGGVIFK